MIWSTGLPVDGDDYDVDIIDTWEMTITPAEKVEAPVPHPTRPISFVEFGRLSARARQSGEQG